MSVLGEEQREVSQRFATLGHDKNRFDFARGQNGAPLVPGALAQIECRLTPPTTPATIASTWARWCRDRQPGRPLVYHAAGYRRLAPEEQRVS